MESSRRPLNTLSSVLGEYLGLRTDHLKKKAIDGLSAGFSRVLAILIMVMLLLIMLAAFAFGCVMLLGQAIGSWGGAAFIVGGVFMIAAVVLFFFRKKLFLGMFTNLFTGIVDADPPEEDPKSVPLMLVRYLRGLLAD